MVSDNDFELLSQFSQALNRINSPDTLPELVDAHARRLLGGVDLCLLRYDPDADQLHSLLHVAGGQRLPAPDAPQGLPDAARLRAALHEGATLAAPQGDGRAWLCAPLSAGPLPLGLLCALLPNPAPDQRRLFTLFAGQTAAALGRLAAQRALDERTQQFETISAVTQSLASTRDVDRLLDLILDKALELLEAEAGSVMLSVPDTAELEFRVVRGPARDDLLGVRLPGGAGLAGAVTATGRPLLVNDAPADARWFNGLDASARFPTQAILTVPLLHQGAVLGVLQVLNKRSGAPFNARDQQLLTAFAGQAVIALENARLLAQTDQALQQRVQELEVLQQLDRALNTTLDSARVLTLALDWLLRICAGTAGAIVLVDEEKRPLRHAAHGYPPEFERLFFAGEPITAGILGAVLRDCRTHVTGAVHAEPLYLAAAPATQSQLTLPLVHQQRLIGAVVIESDRPAAFDAELAARAERVTTHAAAAIANALLYEKVHAANQAKSEFVSLASHELKTPMTAVRGYAQLMLSGMAGELTERQRGFLETIVANVARMGRQIQDLTDISQIETGRLALVWAPVDFAHIVSDTLQTVQALCDEKAIRLALDLPPDLPLVMGDQGRLVQVLTNLLSNACKYSPAGTQVQITLRADMLAARPNRPGEPPIPMVVCAVQDEGYGISAEDQQRLFTKFFRAQDPNIRQSKGTGLGLSISRGIVELHHGRIWVESTLGQGTTFSFAIPQA